MPTDGTVIVDMPITVIVNGQSSGSTPLGVLTGTKGFRYGPVDCDSSCGYNQLCDDTTGTCTTCSPGYAGSTCADPLVSFEAAGSGSVVVVIEGDETSRRIGAANVVLAAPLSETAVLAVDVTLVDPLGNAPRDVEVSPATITLPPGTASAIVTVTAIQDGIRDVNRTSTLTLRPVSGPSVFVDSPLRPFVKAQSRDGGPTVKSIFPTAVPLAGGKNITIAGDNWDEWVEVWIEGKRIGEFRTDRAVVVGSGSTARAGSVLSSSSSSTLLYSSEDARVEVPTSNGDFGTDTGYRLVEILNLHTQSRGSDNTLLYATEDCPEPGQFGFGTEYVGYEFDILY